MSKHLKYIKSCCSWLLYKISVPQNNCSAKFQEISRKIPLVQSFISLPKKALQYVKSVPIRTFSGPYFLALGLNKERYGYLSVLYLSVFSPNAGKYELEKLRIRTLSTRCFFSGKLQNATFGALEFKERDLAKFVLQVYSFMVNNFILFSSSILLKRKVILLFE